MGLFDRFRVKEEKQAQGKALVQIPKDKAIFWNVNDDSWNDPSARTADMNWYKQAFEKVPLVNAIIMTQADQTVQEYYFEGPNSEKLTKWADDVNLTQFFYVMTKNMLIFGNAYAEVVKEGNEIVKLKPINPIWIDVYVNKYGTVIGYTETINDQKLILWGTTGDSKLDDSFSKRIADISSIVHFKYNVISSDKYGLSIIEPIRESIKSQWAMQSNLGPLLKKYVAPLIWAKVGSNEMPAQETVVSDIASTLRDLQAESEVVTSHLVELSVLDFNSKGMDIKTPLAYTEQQIITGGQTPPILLGRTEGTTDKAAEVQLRGFGRHIKSIQRELKIQFEENIISGQDVGDNEDKLIWTKAEEREWEVDIDILRGLVTDGILTPQKANDLLPPKFQDNLPEMVAPLNGQAVGDGGQQIPRPNQMKSNKVTDNPNNPQKTTKNPKSMGKRIQKDTRFEKP